MAYVTSTIGTAQLLLETTSTGRPTGPSREDLALPNAETLGDAYTQLKSVLTNIANDLGTALHEQAGAGLSQVAVAFELTFSGEADVWVVKATGEGSITATLTWDLGKRDAGSNDTFTPEG